MHQELLKQINERLQVCEDELLLDLILKLLIESGQQLLNDKNLLLVE